MDEKKKNSISKFLSLVLRHSPETIGITLNENGWADVEELIVKSMMHNIAFSEKELAEVVSTNDKQRFAFNENKKKIRASQGHSVEIELNLVPVEPQAYLYHGTVAKFLQDIEKDGLKKINRQYMHLSNDIATAEVVGNMRGKAIVLMIDSGAMHNDGYIFYRSENGVWLTDNVPVNYINFTKA